MSVKIFHLSIKHHLAKNWGHIKHDLAANRTGTGHNQDTNRLWTGPQTGYEEAMKRWQTGCEQAASRPQTGHEQEANRSQTDRKWAANDHTVFFFPEGGTTLSNAHRSLNTVSCVQAVSEHCKHRSSVSNLAFLFSLNTEQNIKCWQFPEHCSRCSGSLWAQWT